ncbi:MAG TPA: radical SAM protein [Thermodesulfobacteriota bacterium]|nr:radical SAM protein [Thermodesulfobacteriota bacterium]
MKVLLVQSWLGGAELPIFPLGLASIKSSLKDHDVKVFDPNISQRPFEELEAVLRSFRPEVVGISLRNIDSTNKRKVVFYYGFLRDTIKRIKELSKARVVLGGTGFSIYAREIMEDEPGIDFGVYLEGEGTFARLLENIEAPEKVKSLYIRKNGRVEFTGGGGPLKMEGLGLPDCEGFDIESYKSAPDAFGVETKRGCALECIYCIYGFLNGKGYRLRDPAKVADEIEGLVGKYGVERFTFVDSVFNIPKRHATEICAEIIRRGIRVRWSAWFNERELTEDFAELARKAGCDNFILSPDGFSDGVLKKLGKNITKRDIIRAGKILQGMEGTEVSYNFFKNPPGQSYPAFLALILFCLRARMRMGKRVHFEFNSIRIEPHTRLYETALEEGFIDKADSLLEPRYYTNPDTRLIDRIFNLALRLRGK